MLQTKTNNYKLNNKFEEENRSYKGTVVISYSKASRIIVLLFFWFEIKTIWPKIFLSGRDEYMIVTWPLHIEPSALYCVCTCRFHYLPICISNQSIVVYYICIMLAELNVLRLPRITFYRRFRLLHCTHVDNLFCV